MILTSLAVGSGVINHGISGITANKGEINFLPCIDECIWLYVSPQ